MDDGRIERSDRTTFTRITRCLVSSITMPNCSTEAAPYCGNRYEASCCGVWYCGRSSAVRTSVRRPSSTAATICAARAAPMPRHAQLVGRQARERVQSAGALEDAVGQFERAAFARAAAENDRHQFVVAERGDAEALQLLARPIVLGELFHSAILKS